MSAPATNRVILPKRAAVAALRDRRPPLARQAEGAAKAQLHWAVAVLLISWVMPFVIYLGPVRLTPYRIVLILLFLPIMSWLAQGRAGRLRLADAMLVLFAVWCMISLTAVHGVGTAMQTGGIQVLETLTPYLLARCCIRSADDFRALVRFLTVMVMVLAPFAIIEAVTGHNIYVELASHLYQTIEISDKDPRWGLRRVQLFFDHPILTGVCLGSIVALTHMVLGRELSFVRRWLTGGSVGFTAALSLSSGPLGGIAAQIGLMSWNHIFRRVGARWIILLSIIAAAMLAIQLLARRPLINILLSYSFEPESAFFRTLIWDYGTQSVANHIWFGVGMGRWDRPLWMPPSIDMFWLYNAVVYGLPGGILIMAFFVAAVWSISRVGDLSQRTYDYRTAYMIAMTSFFVTGWMVHFWNGTYVFFLFMVGAGMWIGDTHRQEEASHVAQNGRSRSLKNLHRTTSRIPKRELRPMP